MFLFYHLSHTRYCHILTKHTRGSATGGLALPTIPPIGRSAELVDAVFARAEKAQKDGSIAPALMAERCGAVAVDRRLSLVVFRIEEYKPITQKDYEQFARSADPSRWLSNDLELDGKQQPLSVESLKSRLGFVEEGDGSKDKDEKAEKKETGK